MLGFEVAAELMKRRRAGRIAAAAALERSVMALIAAKPSARFRQFIADEADSAGSSQ